VVASLKQIGHFDYVTFQDTINNAQYGSSFYADIALTDPNGNQNSSFNMSFNSANAINAYFSANPDINLGSPSSPPATSSTPIPAAIWMVGSALAGLLGFVRRKRF